MEYTNKCVLKLFDISTDLLHHVLREFEMYDIDYDIESKYKDVKVTIINNSDDDSIFNTVISALYNNYGSFIYADKDVTLEEKLVESLQEKGKLIGVAESLTGGMVASRIVNVSGASNVLYEGIVAYNPGSKVRRLHVPLPIIESKGMVNADVARAMALGLFDNKSIDYAFSTTGISGPNSDEFNTPIGRVYIGYGDKKFIDVVELNLEGSRQDIRELATNYALFFMLKYILEK